jgi:hypothetical protein
MSRINTFRNNTKYDNLMNIEHFGSNNMEHFFWKGPRGTPGPRGVTWTKR